MIELDALRYRWPGAAHDCLAIDALRVDAGRTLFLHGPSGGGKSTLLGLLAGVLLPTAGAVSLLGRPWASLSGARRDAFRADHVGYIFQQFNLLPYLSVLDNVLLPCRFSALRQQRAAAASGTPQAAAGALLQRVGLSEALWPRRAALLSVGQQQRVAAARALIGQPEVVIADEPTSALDSALRDSFMALLLQQCRDSGSALVFVSHDERLAALFDQSLSLPQINRATPELTA
jgi:putative ABC transport system ATP-binding protein